jgi:hypothetical protein
MTTHEPNMKTRVTLISIILTAGLIASCQSQPSVSEDTLATSVASTLTAGVPPTDTATPTPAEGVVTGKVCFPSEPPLPEMTLYFEDISSGTVISAPHTDGTGTYETQLPPAIYVAYAWRDEDFAIGGSYSQAVPCGLSVECDNHNLLPFTVEPASTTTGIDICDWYGAPGDVPLPPGAPTLPPPTATNTPPPEGISFNCDGTYQRVRITDTGATGRVISVDRWDGSNWINIWNNSAGDPNLRQITDDSGLYTFGGCQQLLVIAVRNSNPQVTMDLTALKWQGSGLIQVYSMQGDYGEWSVVDDRLIFRRATKLGTVGDGPLQPCEWTTSEHAWDGTSLTESSKTVDSVPGCTVTVP